MGYTDIRCAPSAGLPKCDQSSQEKKNQEGKGFDVQHKLFIWWMPPASEMWLMCDCVCLLPSKEQPFSHVTSSFQSHFHTMSAADILYIRLLCQVMEADETPVSIVSCSAEASKNQLRQKYSVNIKGMQRRFFFWSWIIIHLSTGWKKKIIN